MFLFKKNRIQRWVPVLIIYGVITCLSSVEAFDERLSAFLKFDKLSHMIEFFFLGIFLARAVLWNDWARIFRIRWWILGLFFLIVASATDEIHQLFVPSRQFDPLDFAADLSGAITGLFLYGVFKKNFAPPGGPCG